jgi:hypothetical protein
MDRMPAKELLHIEGWLHGVEVIVKRGKDSAVGGRAAK